MKVVPASEKTGRVDSFPTAASSQLVNHYIAPVGSHLAMKSSPAPEDTEFHGLESEHFDTMMTTKRKENSHEVVGLYCRRIEKHGC